MTPDDADAYCFEQVRRGDHDRFLTALFAPAANRRTLFALFALNLELARVPEAVREPMLGEIRLQWWREAIEGLYGGAVRRHPVIEALTGIAEQLPRDLFDRMVDARRLELAEEPPESFNELVEYAADTGGSLVQLAALSLSDHVELTSRERDICQGVGVAWALLGVARAASFQAAHGRVLLPVDLLEREGVRVRDVRNGTDGPGLRRVIAIIRKEAERRLAAARVGGGPEQRAIIPALLPASLADLYIRALARPGYDPLRPDPLVPGFRLQARLLRKALTGRF